MSFFLLLLTLLSGVLVSTAYFPQGTISLPANGSAVTPGKPFDFLYNVRADYCLSSYNFTVWLLTSPPSSIISGEMTGHFFGRFSEENYPANPNPSNPPPSQLVMPDFSKSQGGFGAGTTATNSAVYLAVIEEWDSCTPTFGASFSLAANQLFYNATS